MNLKYPILITFEKNNAIYTEQVKDLKAAEDYYEAITTKKLKSEFHIGLNEWYAYENSNLIKVNIIKINQTLDEPQEINEDWTPEILSYKENNDEEIETKSDFIQMFNEINYESHGIYLEEVNDPMYCETFIRAIYSNSNCEVFVPKPQGMDDEELSDTINEIINEFYSKTNN